MVETEVAATTKVAETEVAETEVAKTAATTKVVEVAKTAKQR